MKLSETPHSSCGVPAYFPHPVLMAGHCALTTGSYRRGGDKNVDWELVALRYISGSSVLDTVSHLGPRLPSERWQSHPSIKKISIALWCIIFAYVKWGATVVLIWATGLDSGLLVCISQWPHECNLPRFIAVTSRPGRMLFV